MNYNVGDIIYKNAFQKVLIVQVRDSGDLLVRDVGYRTSAAYLVGKSDLLGNGARVFVN